MVQIPAMMKVLAILGALLGLLILLGLLLPFLLDLGPYQDRYLPVLERALNREVSIQGVRLTIFPRLGARVSGLVVMDDPAFSPDPFVSLAAVDVGVKIRPLLQQRLEISEVTLREPSIHVIRNSHGTLNLSTLGRGTVEQRPSGEGTAEAATTEPAGPLQLLGLLAVDRFSVSRGAVSYRDLSGATPKEFAARDLDLLLSSVRLGENLRLTARAVLAPFDLPVALTGSAGPLNESLDLEAFELTVRVADMPAKVRGSLLSGTITLGVTAERIQTARLPEAIRPRTPLDVQNLRIDATASPSELRVGSLSLNVFGGTVTAKGGMRRDRTPPPFEVKATAVGVQLAPIVAATGSSRLGVHGQAAAEVALRGQGLSAAEVLPSVHGTAHVAVRNGRIEGLHLVKEGLALLNALGVLPDARKDATIFSAAEGHFTVKHEIVTVDRLKIDGSDFQATATGKVGFDQRLRLKASLSLSDSLSAQVGRLRPMKLAMVDGRFHLPLVVVGTLQAPAFALDLEQVGAQVEKQVKGKLKDVLKSKDADEALRKAGDALKDLFGR